MVNLGIAVLGSQLRIVSISLMSLCGLLIFLSSTKNKYWHDLSEIVPISLLHVGPLTAMMQVPKCLKFK